MEHERLILGISPYHLSTREVPAMAALLLGEQVVTVVPTPDELAAMSQARVPQLSARDVATRNGTHQHDERETDAQSGGAVSREQFSEAVERSPRYLRLMESWRWGACLWKSGVIAGGYRGRTPMSNFATVLERIETDESLALLRPIFANLPINDGPRLLDELSGDVLRGGPNPAMTIPIAAALDRFASEHGVVIARAGVSSIAQRAEASMGRKIFSCAVPALLSADGPRIAKARRLLHEPLVELRAAMHGAFSGDSTSTTIADAARVYTQAFLETPGVVDGDDEEGQRVRWGYVSVVGTELPSDCVLRSSKAAVRTVRGESGIAGNANTETLPRNAANTARLFSLVIKEMSLKPA